MNCRIALPLVFTALVSFPIALAAAQTTKAATSTLFDGKVNAILARPAFKNATVGVSVRSLKTGKTVYVRNANLALIPASNQKIMTASVALRTLGSGFQYRTSVCSTAKPEADGTLRGDLYLRGSGDPSLSSARLETMAKAVAAGGVKRVIGRIVGDGTAFDAQVLGTAWQWDDEPWYYAAQVSGLNCDENVVVVSVRPGANVGDPATILINNRPAGEETYVTLEANVTTVATGKDIAPSLSFDRVRGRNTIVVSGTIPQEAKPVNEDITVEAPDTFAASRFVLALQKAGVVVETPLFIESGATPSAATEIAFSFSQPLSELLKQFLKPSDNLYGEALMKTVGRAASPTKPGSSATGAVAAQAFFKSAGLNADGVRISDGSGLSVHDTLTPTFLCDLLSHIDKKFPATDRAVFINGLPIGGVDGTIRNRFKDTPLAGNVRAKTGTLAIASSLSGYVTAKNGERYVFSILMNHYTTGTEARKAQDDIVKALYER